jgi:hypothetical protein
MTTLLRILRLYPLALWAGGEVFFVLVAGIAFRVLPDAHSAGLVVRSALIDVHWMGLWAGVVYLLATLGLLATRRDTHRVRAAEVALIGVMLALTLYSQRSVIPRMESDRLSLGGDVTAVSKDNPARRDFDRLHSLSVNLEGAVLFCSMVLIALAPIQGQRTLKGASI